MALGLMQGDAGVPTLSHTNKAQPIDSTDAYGRATIDSIHLGIDWFIAFTAMEYSKAGVMAAWFPWHATLGKMGVIGRLYFSLAQALVMTAIAGTPAATSPATLTASKSIGAPNFNTQILFGPVLRTLPMRLQLFPYIVSSSEVGHFSTT